jgi:hypothetical protein
LAETGNLIGIKEKNLQNFPHHHGCLRQKFLLALKKKISKFSAPQPLAKAENLIGLGEKSFKIFHTTRVAWGRNFA